MRQDRDGVATGREASFVSDERRRQGSGWSGSRRLFDKPTPILFDEWRLPEIWDHARATSTTCADVGSTS